MTQRSRLPAGAVSKGDLPVVSKNGSRGASGGTGGSGGNGSGARGNSSGPGGGDNELRAQDLRKLASVRLQYNVNASDPSSPNETARDLDKIIQASAQVNQTAALNDLVSYAKNEDGGIAFLGVGNEKAGLQHLIARGHLDLIARRTEWDEVTIVKEISSRAADDLVVGRWGITGVETPTGSHMFKTALSDKGNGFIVTATIRKGKAGE